MISDEELFREFQGGSQTAFDQLWARYRRPLYGFFSRRLAADGRAEDLTQETFVAVIRNAARYRPTASVRTYLYAIALNLLMNERRKSRDVDPLSNEHEGAIASKTETCLAVRSALRTLDAPEREVLMLREYEQLSYEEIAETLRIPVNTVRSRLFRARMALKQALEAPPRVPDRRGDETCR